MKTMTNPQPLSPLNPLRGDSGPVLAMCGACGGVIEDYSNEISTMGNMQASAIDSSGSKSLWDEVIC